MIDIIDHLKKGDEDIVSYFVCAEEKWQTILRDVGEIDVATLANRLQSSQGDFQRHCGGQHLGKDIMAWSAFAHFYSASNGIRPNGPSAYKLAEAFENSNCSLEIKSAAKTAAEMYGVSDYAPR